MRRWWLVIALLLSVGINIGILATMAFQTRPATGGTSEEAIAPDNIGGIGSEKNPPPLGERSPPVIQRMANELGLEGDRRAAFIEIQRVFFEHTLAARSRMARLQREIRGEVTSADPDREALDQLLTQLSAAHTDLERAFVTNLLDSRQLLDRDQERRFMHFLRRLRQVRGAVERRFRERWRGMGEGRDRLGLRGRARPGDGRFDRSPEDPRGAEPTPPSPER